jgi:hypothetical protein
LPVWRRGGFLGKTVIDTEGAPDDEHAVGDVVSGAKSEFLDVGVEEKWPNFQRERLVICESGAGEPWDGGPFTEGDDVSFGNRGEACGKDKDKNDDEERKREPQAELRETDHGRG